jgi:hypothetical protein
MAVQVDDLGQPATEPAVRAELVLMPPLGLLKGVDRPVQDAALRLHLRKRLGHLVGASGRRRPAGDRRRQDGGENE